MNYTYIVRCADGSLYTGWTDDLEKRVRAHNAGRGAKYTRSRRPVELVYSETFATKEEAMSREWHIKHLSRNEKLKLIAEFGEDPDVVSAEAGDDRRLVRSGSGGGQSAASFGSGGGQSAGSLGSGSDQNAAGSSEWNVIS